MPIVWRFADERMGDDSALDLLMSIDDAMQGIDRNDTEKLKGQQEKVRSQRHGTEGFQREWQKKRTAVRGEVPSCVSASAKAKAKKAATARGERIYLGTFPKGDITQAELGRLCPPNGYIWTDHRQGGFQAHFKGFPRINRLWHLHGGSRSAGILCLRFLWDKWCAVNSKSREDVPIGDLWSCPTAACQPLPPTNRSSSSTDARQL